MGTCLVMINSFKRGLHHKLLFAATFLIPIAICLLIGMIQFDKTAIRVGILEADSENEQTAKELYQLLDQSKGIKYERAQLDTLNIDQITGKYHVILDYRNSSTLGQFELLSYQSDEKNIKIKNALQKAFSEKEPIILTGLKNGGLAISERMTALLLSLLLVFSSIYTATIIKDRQSGTIQRYQFSRSIASSYIFGHLFYVLIITYCQALLCLTALLIVQKNFSLNIIETLIIPLIIAAISTIIGMLISMGSKTEVQANITASALAAIMSLLGGTFVAIEDMPKLLRLFSYVSPVRWIVELVRIL